jgi:hypothetical protein
MQKGLESRSGRRRPRRRACRVLVVVVRRESVVWSARVGGRRNHLRATRKINQIKLYETHYDKYYQL